MSINFKHIPSKFRKDFNPKIGLIVLSTDYTIESDFNAVCKDLPLDVFINLCVHEKDSQLLSISFHYKRLKN